MDVVEVLRGTAAGPLLIAASVVGGVAAVAAVLTAAVWWARDRVAPLRRVMVPLLAVGIAGSMLELGLLLTDGARVTDQWPAIVLVRLLLLVGLSALPDPTGAATSIPAFLTVGLVATALLGAPHATGTLPTEPFPLIAAAGVLALLTAMTAAVLRIAARRGDRALQVAVAALFVGLAVPTALAVAPDRVPPHQQIQLPVGELTLDLTVAPARAGTNEFHLYAFDPDRGPAPLREVAVEVDGAPDSRHELFPVSPDHHLSYVLELPERTPWTLTIDLVDQHGRAHTTTWTLEAPGASAEGPGHQYGSGPVAAYRAHTAATTSR